MTPDQEHFNSPEQLLTPPFDEERDLTIEDWDSMAKALKKLQDEQRTADWLRRKIPFKNVPLETLIEKAKKEYPYDDLGRVFKIAEMSLNLALLSPKRFGDLKLTDQDWEDYDLENIQNLRSHRRDLARKVLDPEGFQTNGPKITSTDLQRRIAHQREIANWVSYFTLASSFRMLFPNEDPSFIDLNEDEWKAAKEFILPTSFINERVLSLMNIRISQPGKYQTLSQAEINWPVMLRILESRKRDNWWDQAAAVGKGLKFLAAGEIIITETEIRTI